jgi:hypothetical protein
MAEFIDPRRAEHDGALPRTAPLRPAGAGQPPADLIETSLEYGCTALLALEASRANVVSVTPTLTLTEAEVDLSAAIDLTRHAIAQLRAAMPGAHGTQLAMEFVLRDCG